MSSSPSQHLAAILPSKGSAFEVTKRTTPTPGPHDLLIEVKSIALNPIDYYMRDYGFIIASYPAIVGSDIAGTVVSAGSAVDSSALKPGTRIAAFAACFFVRGAPDYGAFQTHVLVPAANVVALPKDMSFNEGALLPMAVTTAWSGWYQVGVPLEAGYTAADKKGMLVWGGASSIGGAAVQSAKLMGYTVYVTASAKHHDYLRGLGADKLFDYKDKDVVEQIVKAAKEDGVVLQTGYDAIGEVQSCLDILKEFKGETGSTMLTTSKPMSPETPKAEGIEVKFVAAPAGEKERTEFFHFVWRVWLQEKLDKKEFVPSPKIQVVGSGLEALQTGLDELKKGVSGVKLVVEV